MKRHIPNLITLLNLASGFTAVIFIMHGDILTASWVLVAALFFDFADGLAARLLKAWSELGKELDSLADVVSFGVAPGLLVYTLAGDSAPQWARILLSAMLPVLAALRLAKFNTDPDQKDSFVGLPSPAAAIAIITLVLSMAHSGKGTPDLVAGNQIALFAYSSFFAVLMVTPVRLLSLKMKSTGFRANFRRYLLVVSVAAVIIIAGYKGLFLITPLYLLVSFTDYLS